MIRDLGFGISDVLQSRAPDAGRNQVLRDGFGVFPKISTPVENIVEKRALPTKVGAEIAISRHVSEGESPREADFTACAGDGATILP